MATWTIVDSNVLLDVMTEDVVWATWSADSLAEAAELGPVAINPIVYGRVSVRFNRIEDVDETLTRADYRRLELPRDAAFLAGKAFVDDRRCGGSKRPPLPNFYIGAHAAVSSMRLLTRDASRWRTYFPTVDPVVPPKNSQSGGEPRG